MDPTPPTAPLRWLVTLICVVGGALVLVGMTPGREIYVDPSRCNGLAEVFAVHSRPCSPDWEFARVDLASTPVTFFWVVALLLPAPLVYNDARPRNVALWCAWGWLCTVAAVVVAVATLRFGSGERSEPLWTAEVFMWGLWVLGAFLLVLAPCLAAIQHARRVFAPRSTPPGPSPG